jgi:hypothetical protein
MTVNCDHRSKRNRGLREFFLLVLLISALLLLLAGCKPTPTPPPGETAQPSATATSAPAETPAVEATPAATPTAEEGGVLPEPLAGLATVLPDGWSANALTGDELAALAPAMGFLLVASVSTAIVLNVSPLAVELLAGPTQREEAGRFLNALLVARVPLFFFQAVQASLLPKLSSLAADGHLEEFRQVLGRLLALVAALGVVAVAACAVAGHLVVEMAFGAEFAVGRRDMVLLAASSAVLMIVLSLAQALIAQRCQGRMALAWLAGLCAFPVVLAFGGDLFLRVELALLATVVTAMVAMAVLLARRPGLLH